MNFKKYQSIIFEWSKKYGVPARTFRYDPLEVKLACEKCGHVRAKMARHHKANDFFFALQLPDVYAKRYIEFRKEDIAKLCDKCHKAVERYYEPLKSELYDDLHRKHFYAVDEEWCEGWRKVFLSAYEKWIKRPIRKPRSTKKHKSKR